MPKVSIIMSTYLEEENYLRLAIESILQQTFRDFEYIIILDNPKNKLHISIIKEYLKQDERIRFYINEENLGLTKTLNKGLHLAKGKYICRMDADDVSEISRIELQKKYLEENDLDLIGGITQIIDENNQPIYSIKSVPYKVDAIKRVLRYNQCIAHPTWFGKKEVFDNLKGYREIPLCEDYDFTLRAIMKGYKISNLNYLVLKYRMTTHSISRNNLYSQYLYSKYITKCYKNGVIADINNAKIYVEKKYNDKKSKKYIKANSIFNQSLTFLENHKYAKCIFKCMSIPFISLEYINKIYRLVAVTVYSR